MSSTIDPDRVLLEEPLRPGQMWSRVLKRGQGLRIQDVEGGANVAALLYNADHLLERYNMPDTLKGQFTAYLTEGYALHSDMGRILCSIIEDTSGWHDTVTGCMDAAKTKAKYGDGSYQKLHNEFYRNSRDNFLIELGKYGLSKRDVIANVNFFTKVTVGPEGDLEYHAGHARPGASVSLRSEMNVLAILSNTPHPMNPATEYPKKPVELTLFRAHPRREDDAVRLKRPENARALELTDRYFL